MKPLCAPPNSSRRPSANAVRVWYSRGAGPVALPAGPAADASSLPPAHAHTAEWGRCGRCAARAHKALGSLLCSVQQQARSTCASQPWNSSSTNSNMHRFQLKQSSQILGAVLSKTPGGCWSSALHAHGIHSREVNAFQAVIFIPKRECGLRMPCIHTLSPADLLQSHPTGRQRNPAQAAGGCPRLSPCSGGRRRRSLQQVHVRVEGVGARAQPAHRGGVAAGDHHAAGSACANEPTMPSLPFNRVGRVGRGSALIL